ncbi:natriuretic peptides B [Brachyistius frenatus]|uniref:natriuretic peptides B n=1 Tax=Brachyistius frenatus TaxID=100188 RepID=UPI0037E9B5E9
MCLFSMQLCGFLLIVNLQLSTTYPIRTGLTETDVDVLKELLHRLEDSVLEQNQRPAAEDRLNLEDADDGPQTQTGLQEADIREFLSAKNLKSIRNDSSKRSSGCFGRRMDRIGSMSSLGCNTVGRYNPK